MRYITIYTTGYLKLTTLIHPQCFHYLREGPTSTICFLSQIFDIAINERPSCVVVARSVDPHVRPAVELD